MIKEGIKNRTETTQTDILSLTAKIHDGAAQDPGVAPALPGGPGEGPESAQH